MNWINPAWDRDRGSCECGNEPLGSVKYEECID